MSDLRPAPRSRTSAKAEAVYGGQVTSRLFGKMIERRRWLKRRFLSLPGKPISYQIS